MQSVVLQLANSHTVLKFAMQTVSKVSDGVLQELLDKFGLGSCISLFWQEQLYDMKVCRDKCNMHGSNASITTARRSC